MEMTQFYSQNTRIVHYIWALKKRLAYTLFLLLLSGLFTGSSSHKPPLPTCKSIITQMLNSIDMVKGLAFKLTLNERIKGKINITHSITKLNKSPRKIYMNLKGPELLWVQGTNNNNALVNPGGFPYINLNLDPMGSLLRDKQHHTIHEIGFDYYADILRASIKFCGTKFDSYFKLTGEVKWNNRDCYSVTAEYPEFKYVDYTVKKGEDLIKISRALFVSEYMVLEANAETVDSYYDVSEGQVIKVPIIYGKKIELLIDKQHFLPIKTKIYDDKGLFEAFEYEVLFVNPPFSPDEFSKNYKDYRF